MDLAEKVMKGEYTGAVTLYGMDKGAIQFKVNPALAGKVTPEAMTLVEQMRADMISGKLVAPKDDF
jgi:basic membrane lipoprotein Med (substrate-binding protein (PBP1-ABC) superfamily)